jgi:perosamine synthetase
LLGQPMNIESLRYRFPRAVIIEDCAQALGASVRGRKVGGIGELGCFSFQETKTLTTLGEGGMITTNSEVLAELCRNIRNHGEKYGKKPYLGYNYRMTEAAAAFGRSQLKRLDTTLKQQINCAKIVRDNLPRFLEPLKVPSTTKPVFFLVGTKTKQEFSTDFPREKFTTKAQELLFHNPPAPGRTIGLGYTELIPDLPLYQSQMTSPKIPVAREMIKRSVWFDIHRFTDVSTVEARMEALKEVKI